MNISNGLAPSREDFCDVGCEVRVYTQLLFGGWVFYVGKLAGAEGLLRKLRRLGFSMSFCIACEAEWLGRRDSNPRMVEPKSTALPLGDAPLL